MRSTRNPLLIMTLASIGVASAAACAPIARPVLPPETGAATPGPAAIVPQTATPKPAMTPSACPDFSPGDQVSIDAALIVAAGGGDLACVRTLLALGADVKAVDARGRTALIMAAYGNFVDVARVLVEAGADVNVKDDTQQSAYLIPTADGNLEFLRLMLASGADVQSLDRFNGTGLIRAADRGHHEIIRELLPTGIDPNHINNLDWTALLEAIILGDGSERYVETVRLLIEGGADVNLADGNGVTPLQHARKGGYTEIIRLLEEADAR